MKPMTKRAALARGSYYFCYFAAQACMAGCLNLYLTQWMRFSRVELGWFSALTALAPALVLGLLGKIADNTGCVKLFHLAAVGAVLLFGAAMARAKSLFTLILFGAVWEIARAASVSLADRSTAGEKGKGYGWFRSMGSLGYLAGGAVMGVLAQRWGLGGVLFPLYLALVALSLVLAAGFGDKGAKKSRPHGSGQKVRLWRSRGVVLGFVMCALSSLGSTALQPWLGNYLVEELGASHLSLTWNTLLCVGPELVLLPVFSTRLIPKWGNRACFFLTGFALLLRCGIYSFAPGVPVFLTGSLLYGFSVCGQTAVSLSYLKGQVPEWDYTRAVTTAMGVSCAARGVCGWLFGQLSQQFGTKSVFLVLGGITLLGLILLRQIPYDSTSSTGQ